MRQVQSTEMSVTTQSKIGNLDRVRPHVTNLRRPHEEPIPVKLLAGAVIVEMDTALNRVAFANEILPKNIRGIDILAPSIKAIEPAVGVLLQHGKVSRIVLVMIVAKRAENPCSQVVIRKYEAPKIRYKG